MVKQTNTVQAKASYKVVKAFILDHQSQQVGIVLELSARQAQHLVLGGFIEVAQDEAAVSGKVKK